MEANTKELHLETDCLETPSCCASSSCDQPLHSEAHDFQLSNMAVLSVGDVVGFTCDGYYSKIASIAHHLIELKFVNSELRNNLPAETSDFGKVAFKSHLNFIAFGISTGRDICSTCHDIICSRRN